VLRHGAIVGSPLPERKPSPARIVPIPDACRGAHLTLDEELSACACDETETRVVDGTPAVSAGRWCGLPHPNETRRATLAVSAERTVLAPGEGASVVVRLANPGPDTAVYRASNRHLSARLALANGQPFPDESLTSSRYADEALFELPPGGTMEVRLSVLGTYARWVGSGEGATIENAKLSPGTYAIQVFLGGLGGEASRLVAIQVR
jgi:hypothetical protein